MPRRLTDSLAHEMFSKHLRPDDGDLTWIFGVDTPSQLAFWLFLGPLLSAWKTKCYLLGLTRRRLILLKMSRWMKETECRSIEFSEITSANVEESRDPYNTGSFIAVPGKKLAFTLQDGSSYRMGSLTNFKGIPNHGENLEKVAAQLATLSARRAGPKQ